MARKGLLSRLRLREQPINASTPTPEPKPEPEETPADRSSEGPPAPNSDGSTQDQDSSAAAEQVEQVEEAEEAEEVAPGPIAPIPAKKRRPGRLRRQRPAAASEESSDEPKTAVMPASTGSEPDVDSERDADAERASDADVSDADADDSTEERRKPSRGLLAGAAVIIALGVAAAVLIATGAFDSDDKPAVEDPPAPRVAAPEPDPPAADSSGELAAAELGFPGFATKNTTRIGGPDAATTAAGAALATFPSAGGSPAPDAVTIVDSDDWQTAIASAVLMAEPVRAPLLLSESGELPPATEQALTAMDPQGAQITEGAAVFTIGTDAAGPDGVQTTRISGTDPAATAAEILQLRRKLTGEAPDHIVVATADDEGFAMPAAAWAARSGDAVLFTNRDELPVPTRQALTRNKNVPVYVLGPPSAITDAVLRQISKAAGQVRRISGDDPVTSAIEFARYADGTFGWNINDPGHGFVVARSDSPLDAAAAAPISASGTWGPLLLTDSVDTLSGALRGYLLDVKPGYRTDPTRALYNHIWIIGDENAIDVNQQAALDDLAELARIGDPGEPADGQPVPDGQGGDDSQGPNDSSSTDDDQLGNQDEPPGQGDGQDGSGGVSPGGPDDSGDAP